MVERRAAGMPKGGANERSNSESHGFHGDVFSQSKDCNVLFGIRIVCKLKIALKILEKDTSGSSRSNAALQGLLYACC